ncbi:hypothetical protein G3M81_23020 [Bacillus paralicheniformis]|uniref:ArdC-like ssDNA-binding domain-containing protein n=1 Tax=Bacillus TaxID=1386 RepID=UPI0013EE77A8|nr:MULTISPECIES: ArdC-like ssDNA-binding domain-containing protein [Bacillus]QII26964.1 hypothetical protein G3M80_20930 [Bacillus altitudinis]QII51432.1 hypothetical protein G3M81_23020 [Bacillus paralicheniformis]
MSPTKVLSKDDVNKALENSLSDIFENDRFKDMLDVMSHTKNYSLNNSILIMAQRPTSTMIMGYKDWQKKGRQVSKGEKGIKILAPYMRKVDVEKVDPVTKKQVIGKDGNPVVEKKDVPVGYFQVNVFDIEQTEGKEIPKVRDFIKRNMKEDDYVNKLYKDYKTYLTETKNNVIKEQPTEKGVGGYFDRTTGNIVISSSENDNDTEKFRVLIHEYAHSLLHHRDSEMKNLPRGHKEAQAESTAYIVNKYYGLDTTDVSAGYIATWSKDMKLAKQALEEIQEVSNTIIDDIDRLQKEKIQSFYKEQTRDYEEAKKHLIEYHGIDEKAFDPEHKKETRLQLINKENGYIMSGKLEYNQKEGTYFLRTNRNLIEPLSEIAKDGNLAVLNVEKELDHLKEFKVYSRIPDHYEVKQVRNGSYVVQSSNGQDVISKGFSKKDDALEFQKRSAIAQALHQSTMLNAEKSNSQLQHNLQEVKTEIEDQINKTVGDYISGYSEKAFRPTGTHGITIGWTLLKNPNLKNVDQLKEFAEKYKHVPTYKKLQNALTQGEENEHQHGKQQESTKKKEEKVIVIEEYEQVIDR